MDLHEMIEEIDIVEFISQFVELEEHNGEYWGLSPFKEENTPSFSVRRESGRFYDFSSGIGGNVFTFVKNYYKCSASQAVNKLREYLGCSSSAQSIGREKKLSATSVCKKFIKHKSPSKQSSTRKQYPDNYMDRFENREDKLKIWEDEGISKESLSKFSVKYDCFSERIVYPIRNISGQIVNIGGRTTDKDWKEKNIRKYTYFSGWGEMDVIYGLFENMDDITSKKEIILFEGCKSVLLADTWGIHNTGALLTSHLNPRQMKVLARLGVRVVFALDNEIDIKTDKNIEKLKRYVPVEYIHDSSGTLGGKDSPVDKGEPTFRNLYKTRESYK